MLKLRQGVIELYRKVATSLPPDVEAALKEAHLREPEGSEARANLGRILQSVQDCRGGGRPLCLGSGVPVFYARVPKGLEHEAIRQALMDATREATKKIPLAMGAVDVLRGENTGDGTGEGLPVIHIEQSPDSTLTVELLLVGSGGENEGRTYGLPDEALGAGRNLAGVGLCVLDAVERAGGRGCPPYTVMVGIGATREAAVMLSSLQLRRKLPDRNPQPELAAWEERLLEEINTRGAEGGGPRTTALGVKLGIHHRHPGTFFVDVTLSCWSFRRGKLIW